MQVLVTIVKVDDALLCIVAICGEVRGLRNKNHASGMCLSGNKQGPNSNLFWKHAVREPGMDLKSVIGNDSCCDAGALSHGTSSYAENPVSWCSSQIYGR